MGLQVSAHLGEGEDVGFRGERDDCVLLAEAHDGAHREAVDLDGKRRGPAAHMTDARATHVLRPKRSSQARQCATHAMWLWLRRSPQPLGAAQLAVALGHD
jgi:hypothetical protein